MYPHLVSHWIDDTDVTSSVTFEKRCPIDDRLLTAVARGSAETVCAAVDAAARVAEAWARTTAPARGAILARAGVLLREREQEFAE